MKQIKQMAIASHARALMTDYVAPSKGEILKYRKGVLNDVKYLIAKAARRNKKSLEFRMNDRYDGDGYWLLVRLKRDGFEAVSWATGSANKTFLTIAWVGDAPGPSAFSVMRDNGTFWILGVIAAIFMAIHLLE